MGWGGGDVSENNTGFVHNSSIIAPFNQKSCYVDRHILNRYKYVNAREVYASARRDTEPGAAVLAKRGGGTVVRKRYPIPN